MRPLNEIIVLNHFYYCLLLAIKLRKNNSFCAGNSHMKPFLRKWLTVAKKKKLFSKLVFDEICWLSASLNDRKMTCSKFEYQIELIYFRSSEMLVTPPANTPELQLAS